MQNYPFSRRFPNLLVISIFLFGILLGISYFNANRTTSTVGHAIPQVKIHPRYRHESSMSTKSTVFACQTTTPVGCYGPQQIRNAYNIQPLLKRGITGRGRTIVIIDAFQAPKIQNDLHIFDQTFGLNDPKLNIIAPDGLTPFDPTNPSHLQWSAEITLDVEWAHAIAPDATIDLVLAKSEADADLLSVIKYAVNKNLGDVLSMSFGEAETCMDPQLLKQYHATFFDAARKGITIMASSTDDGAAQPTCDGNSYFLNAGTPASDPLVTAVGGTQLNADGLTGDYKSEATWNESIPGQVHGASGGGFSTIYHKPYYQSRIAGIGNFRGVPDVAYDAAFTGGVLVVWSSPLFGDNQVLTAAGTSAGVPQWAAIAALGCQLGKTRLGFLNPALYLFGTSKDYSRSFHDITSGNNTFVGTDINGNEVTINGYNATSSWDAATGWGSPNVSNLLPPLVALITSTAHDRDSNLASLN